MQVQSLRSTGLLPELVTHIGNQYFCDPSYGGRGSDDQINGGDVLSFGHMSLMGRRREMDDAMKVVPPWSLAGEYTFLAVYDGHGGAAVAERWSDELYKCLEKHITDNMGKEKDVIDWGKLMVKCFNSSVDEVNAVATTAVVVVLMGKEEVVVANCGDPRAVLCRRGAAVPLSTYHKGGGEDEKERVEAAGGRIINCKDAKGTFEPEVIVMRRTECDDFVIIATDGLWDVVSNEIACEVVKKCLSGSLRRSPTEECGASEAGSYTG